MSILASLPILVTVLNISRDPDFAKRRIIQADLRTRLPGLSINMGGATSIDITKAGVDKGYGLKRLRDVSGVPLKQILFVGDAIVSTRVFQSRRSTRSY